MPLFVEYRDLGRMDYAECWSLQRSLFDAMLAAKGAHCIDASPDDAATDARDDSAGTILTVEHPPVYTLGKHGHRSNMLASEERLRALGADFYAIDRGGDITFHGDGQIVVYPILDLERLGIGLREYIDALEQSVIDTLAPYGIRAGRSHGASGVWLGQGAEYGPDGSTSAAESSATAGPLRKICAIGVRASRFVTMHGLALNVTTDLQWFNNINPCGFTDRGVTSMQRELGSAPAIDRVREELIQNLTRILNVKIYKN